MVRKRTRKDRSIASQRRPSILVTEQDLLRNFEKYKKVVDELEALYPVNIPDVPRETSETTYVSEPLFFYRVHASV
jgi:hypothetical protein